MSYAVKEIFLTLQGEGANAGRAAVFCRFAGCNLWSGLETDRASAICTFCDTDFVGMDGELGGRYQGARELASAIEGCWKGGLAGRFVVFTGGEPLLQLDRALVDEIRQRGFFVAIETNGTLPVPIGVDWICVSPKSSAPVVQTTGNELKLVYPQAGLEPNQFEHLRFDRFLLQPMDGRERESNTRRAIDYCLQNPRWQLSIQTHKMLGIP